MHAMLKGNYISEIYQKTHVEVTALHMLHNRRYQQPHTTEQLYNDHWLQRHKASNTMQLQYCTSAALVLH